MACRTTNSPERRGLMPAMTLLAGVLAVLAGMALGPSGMAEEAAVCEGICRAVMQNAVAGRQALVSSVWWPPVPVLLRMPLCALLPADMAGTASRLVSLAMAFACAVLLEKRLREWSSGRLRFLFVAAMVVNPLFIRESLSGSSSTTVLFLVLLAAGSLAQWVSTRRLHYLVTLGLACGLLPAAGFAISVWPAVVLVLLALDTARTKAAPHERGAVAIVALLPLLYVLALWSLMNWLIMGDPFYFMRSLLVHGLPSGPTGTLVPGGLAALVAGALCACLWMVAVRKSDRAGMFLAVLGSALLGAALWVSARGWTEGAEPFLFCLAPLLLLAAGYAASRIGGGKRAGIAVVLAVWCVGLLLSVGSARPPASGLPSGAEGMSLLPRIESHVLKHSPYARVMVCGYNSFALLQDYRGTVFEPLMDFHPAVVEQEEYERPSFLLVPSPQGHHAMESIHWAYDRLYVFGGPGMLYDSDWGKWRLFEIVRAPRK